MRRPVSKPGFPFGSVGLRQFVFAPLHMPASFPPIPCRHLTPTPPVFPVGPLRLGLPYMGMALSRGRSLAGAVTRASVNKGAGRSLRRASPREGAGPRGTSAHAWGSPFSLPPGGGAAGEGSWGACPGLGGRSSVGVERRRVQDLGPLFASK